MCDMRFVILFLIVFPLGAMQYLSEDSLGLHGEKVPTLAELCIMTVAKDRVMLQKVCNTMGDDRLRWDNELKIRKFFCEKSNILKKCCASVIRSHKIMLPVNSLCDTIYADQSKQLLIINIEKKIPIFTSYVPDEITWLAQSAHYAIPINQACIPFDLTTQCVHAGHQFPYNHSDMLSIAEKNNLIATYGLVIKKDAIKLNDSLYLEMGNNIQFTIHDISGFQDVKYFLENRISLKDLPALHNLELALHNNQGINGIKEEQAINYLPVEMREGLKCYMLEKGIIKEYMLEKRSLVSYANSMVQKYMAKIFNMLGST